MMSLKKLERKNTDGRVTLLYCWKLLKIPASGRKVLSNFSQFNNQDTFQFGLSNNDGLISLYLYAKNIQNLGIEIPSIAVSCSIPNSFTKFMPEKFGQEISLVFRLRNCMLAFHTKLSFKIYFKIFISNKNPLAYKYILMDDFYSPQLWDAANSTCHTDIEFHLNDTSFPAHRAVVAARSLVWSRQFSINLAEREFFIHEDIEPIIFKNLLHFIYTGQLKTVPCLQLLKLAQIYEVESLTHICKHACGIDKRKELNSLIEILHHNELEKYSSAEISDSDGDIFFEEKLIEIQFDCSNEIGVEKEFRHFGQFRTKCQKHLNSENELLQMLVTLTHFSTDGEFDVKEAYCSCSGFPSIKQEQIPMAVNFDENGLKGFSCVVKMDNAVESPCFKLTFNLYLFETVKNWSHQLLDTLLPAQLWSAAVNEQFTDVVFDVGSTQTFAAHRAVLAARSPVFAAMFNHQMQETLTGSVLIRDVKPDIFEEFLYFIYTGQLRVHAGSHELCAIAEKYQVETLSKLCQHVMEHESESRSEQLSQSLLMLL